MKFQISDVWRTFQNRGAYERLASSPQCLLATGEEFSVEFKFVRPWPLAGKSGHSSQIASIRGLGFEGIGIGAGMFDSIAIHKALSEAYERLVFRALKGILDLRTSNGMAAHPSAEDAAKNAVREALERDAVLVQWLTSTPMLVVSDWAHTNLSTTALQALGTTSFKLRDILISTKGLVSTMTLLVESRDGGVFIVSHAGGHTAAEAFDRALVELERSVTVIEAILPLKPDFESLDDPLLQNLIFTPARLAKEPWIRGATVKVSDLIRIWRSDASKKFPVTNLATGDLTVCRCASPLLQDLFVNLLDDSQLNWNRLGNSVINRRRHFVA